MPKHSSCCTDIFAFTFVSSSLTAFCGNLLVVIWIELQTSPSKFSKITIGFMPQTEIRSVLCSAIVFLPSTSMAINWFCSANSWICAWLLPNSDSICTSLFAKQSAAKNAAKKTSKNFSFINTWLPGILTARAVVPRLLYAYIRNFCERGVTTTACDMEYIDMPLQTKAEYYI